MFVNILISIPYFAIHVTRLTLNPNVFITRFHSEAHLASNLTGGRFVYWLTSHCITWPTVWIAIFRWAGTSGTSNLLISLNCTFWEWGNLMVKDTPTIMHIVGLSLNVVLRFGSEKSNTKMRKTEINSLRVSTLISSLKVLPSCTWNHKSIGTLDQVPDSVYNDVFHFPVLVVQNIFLLRKIISDDS